MPSLDIEGDPEHSIPLERMSRDLVAASITLSPTEVRYLVDTYYQMQDQRMRSAAQVREMAKSGEPHKLLLWVSDNSMLLENQIKRALDRYSLDHPVGQWMRTITGIGPVIASGLLSHIDITKAPTVGHIWSYSGLNPTAKWLPKTKRPWNASLKRLCWIIGQCFTKVSGNPKDVYGKIILARREYETKKNEAGDYKEQAAAGAIRVGKDTKAYSFYKEGKLPPGHILSRSQRYAVKLFLAHMHHVWYWNHFKQPPPLPYPIAIMGHAHVIPPPNWVEPPEPK